MSKSVLARAIRGCADPGRAQQLVELLDSTSAAPVLRGMPAERGRIVAALLSGSKALGNQLTAHPDWFEVLQPEALKFARRDQGMRNEIAAWLKPALKAGDYSGALSRIRVFKQREMLRIAARDLARLSHVEEITRELSDVADVCLGGVWQVCQQRLVERFGRPWHLDANNRWQPTACCLFGLGKLGGQELNYGSDVDVLFVYSDEGQVFKEVPSGRKASKSVMANHAWFNRFAEAFIAEVIRLATEGMLYRIDLRLRPEGDTGPLTRSLVGYENYYVQWGQMWERMMLMKARKVAGDEVLAAEFLEMIQPFRYPRTINAGVLREVGAMKDRIETEVLRADELERNVKLGRGGIREIEFLVQSQQLLHAGRQPFLQTGQTLVGLEKLAQYNLLSGADARALRDAYCFLRNVEHRLQMDENLQTHTIPENRVARQRLARLMGFRTATQFEAARRAHTDHVRRISSALFKPERVPEESDTFPAGFEDSAGAWKQLLAQHSFQDTDKAVRMLREFVEGPGYVHVSQRTKDLARRLLPRLFALCPKQEPGGGGVAQRPTPENCQAGEDRPVLSDPGRVLTRLDSFVAAYGARAVLFDLWYSNPAIFELLILLFDRSEFLAELAIRTPDMVDELVTSGRLRQRKAADETLRDLRHGLNDKDQHLWLRRYHHTELMRIGLRDILTLADFEQYLQELSALADACLRYALEAVARRHRLRKPPFVIIGLGKLGGAEIDYGSDLDIVFVADVPVTQLPRLGRLALEVTDLLSTRTEAGIVFHTDARLRPDGEKGLLVNTMRAYEEYYRQRARLWEIQALTRARAVAGDLKLGEQFQALAASLTDLSGRARQAEAGPHRSSPPACVTSDWKQEIHRMRLRIEKERTPAGKDDLAIKTGKGGLIDAEFVAQTLCLENGWQEANTLRALERGRDTGVLESASELIASYRQLRRVEGILRRWSYEGETVLPDDPAPYYRVSVRCGFRSPAEFRDALAEWRRRIREVYLEVFAPAAGRDR